MASSNQNGGEEDSDTLSSEKQESLLNGGAGAAVAAVNDAENKDNVEDALPRLEEEVALQQLSLQSLSNKRRLLELQIEVEKSKRRKHIVTLQSLQKRKMQLENSRKTHLNLWREVKCTLEKCQERYKRMAPSTDLEERDGSGSTAEEGGSEGLGKMENPHTKDVMNLDETIKSSDAPKESELIERRKLKVPIPLLCADQNALRDFWSSSTNHNNNGISIFLPFIDSSTTLQKIMKIMALEILNLDMKYPNSSAHRAQSVLGTCLDVSSYRSKAVSRAIQGRLIHEDDDTLEGGGSTNIDESTILQIDPDVVLCPYELSGVCADIHCPYQHTIVRSGMPGGELMTPRELLPLPQLRLPASPMSFDEYTETNTSNSSDVATSTELHESQKDDVLSNKKVVEAAISNDATGSPELVTAVDMESDEESNDDLSNDELGEDVTSNNEEENENGIKGIDWGSNPDFIGLPTIPMDTKTTSQVETSTGTKDEIPPWTTFWWSEEKDLDRARVLKWKNKDTHSVTDILYLIAGFQCRPATTNEDGSNANVVDMILCYDLPSTETLSKASSFVGRVIDCTRLMIHAGRYDIAEALYEMAQNTMSNVQKDETSTSSHSKQESTLLDILHRIVHHMGKITKGARNRKSNEHFFIIYETKVQFVLVFLSEYLRLLQYNFENYGLDESSTIAFYSDAFDFLEETCRVLFDSSKKESCDDDNSSSNQVEYRETVIRLKDALQEKVPSTSPLESAMNAVSEEERSSSDVARNSMKELLADIQLGQSFLSENISFAEASSLCEGLLKPCFAEVRTFLNREEPQNILNGKTNPLVRVVILIGHLLMGVVQMFSTNFSTSLTHLDMCGSATVIEIDVGIHKLLQYLLRELRRNMVPASTKMLELSLSPLCAFSASLPLCVGQYVKAQHRLEAALEVVEDEGIFTFGYLSDLFWSSIAQLRGSLPAPQATHTDDDSRRMRLLLSLPLDIRREHDAISERISSYGIYLNHISLMGDWNLLREWNNPEASSRDAFHQSCCALVTTYLHRTGKDSDTIVLNLNRVLMKDYPIIENSKDTMSALSAFPQSILVCGSSIVNLQMRNCGLQSLPVSFGLHLDRLQNLDLSNNSLSCLPDSIGKLVALCDLDISSNFLEGSIHDQIGMLKNLKKLYASKNQITDIPISSIVGCRMLELLDVRDNQLQNPLSHELPLKLTKLTTLLVEGNPIMVQR